MLAWPSDFDWADAAAELSFDGAAKAKGGRTVVGVVDFESPLNHGCNFYPGIADASHFASVGRSPRA